MQQIWNYIFYSYFIFSDDYIYSLAYLFLSSAGAGDAIEDKISTRNNGRFIL